MLQLVGATGKRESTESREKNPDHHGCSWCIMDVNGYGTLSDKCGKPIVESLHGAPHLRHVGVSIVDQLHVAAGIYVVDKPFAADPF
jgi:hypothetical protein